MKKVELNRCAQVLADECLSELVTLIHRCKDLDFRELSFESSLKYLIINDPKISVEITSPTSFEIQELNLGDEQADGPAISEARLSDFLLGAVRVKKQYQSIVAMRDSGTSAAWLLVSAYYCAFFACIELCKILSSIAISFEKSDLQSLSMKAVGADHASFFSGGHSNFVGVRSKGRITFTSTGKKPHAAAWENATKTLLPLFAPKGWPDANAYIKLIGDPKNSPSVIRNAWNYKRSDFFGETGEIEAKEFKKLVGNHRGSSLWNKRKLGTTSDLDPCIVAAVCEVLSAAVMDAGRRAEVVLSSRIRFERDH